MQVRASAHRRKHIQESERFALLRGVQAASSVAEVTRELRETPRGAVIPDATRRKVRRRFCQICGAEYEKIQMRYAFAKYSRPWVPRQNLDHIIPVRWVNGRSLGNPNAVENLVSLCHKCNLAKKKAEDCLFKADAIGFVQNLQRRGWGFELRRAAKYFGLIEIADLVRL